MTLDKAKLNPYFNDMAKELRLSTVELAEGILSIANTTMEKAVRVISVERGYDPGEFILFSFGGAGGMHAVYLARLLNIPKVLIPKDPGILSARGMLMADIIKDYSLTVMLKQDDTSEDQLSRLFRVLEIKGRDDLLSETVEERGILLERYLDMRYEGQSYEIIVPFNSDYVDGFHGLHEKRYGYKNREKRVEVVNLRLRARGMPEKPLIRRSAVSPVESPEAAFLGHGEVFFDYEPMKTEIFHRERLERGNRVRGPAVLVEYSSTVVVPPFAEAVVDEYGNIVMEIG